MVVVIRVAGDGEVKCDEVFECEMVVVVCQRRFVE